MKGRRKPAREDLQVTIEGNRVPLTLFRERRRSLRIARGASSFLLRIPKGLSTAQEQEALQWAGDWVSKQARQKPGFLASFQENTYRSGDRVVTCWGSYSLEITKEERKTLAGRVKGDRFYIQLPASGTHNGALKQLISRLLAKEQLGRFTQRVREINENNFQERIEKVRLRYNRSRWGSCSSKRNLSFSTRLLLAPEPVIDYVIIHELAHLREMNHSRRFWDLVERACPDYRTHEKWLRENGAACDF